MHFKADRAACDTLDVGKDYNKNNTGVIMNSNNFGRIVRKDNERLFYNIFKTYGMADIKESNYIDTIHLYNEPVPHIKFAPFEKSSFVSQCFSTRLGGVSSGMFKSMNLTFNKVGSYEADLRDNVMENFRRMGKVINTPVEDMVYSKQTHTNNVLYVDDSNRGMGIVKDRNYDNIDGLVTGTKELTLVTSFADCIPVVMADEKSRCIASVHAGWRGTVSNIVKNAINMMTDKFGSNPCDIIAFIGPGICGGCYEVSQDTINEFRKNYSQSECELIIQPENKPGKYLLNLSGADYINLINAGVRPENIYLSDVCTSDNSDILFSHRASSGKRGIMCNFIKIIN